MTPVEICAAKRPRDIVGAAWSAAVNDEGLPEMRTHRPVHPASSHEMLRWLSGYAAWYSLAKELAQKEEDKIAELEAKLERRAPPEERGTGNWRAKLDPRDVRRGCRFYAHAPVSDVEEVREVIAWLEEYCDWKCDVEGDRIRRRIEEKREVIRRIYKGKT